MRKWFAGLVSLVVSLPVSSTAGAAELTPTELRWLTLQTAPRHYPF